MSLSPEMIGSLFEMSREPVIGIGPEKAVIFANQAAAALLGVRAGDSAAGVLPEDILDDPAEQFIASHQLCGRRANVSVRRLDGVMICTWSVLQPVPLRPDQGRALEQFSSSLMSARLAIDALVRGTKAEESDAMRTMVETLYREYYRMRRTCQHMKLSASILDDSLPMMTGVTDLGVLCGELCDTVSRLFEDVGIRVVFEADFGLHLTMADSGLLEQMLSNLLSNSLAHCRAGDSVRVGLRRQGDRFILSVQDTGSGISPEQMARLFNSAPAGDGGSPDTGAGLGLLIARGIAERHGGTLILESRPGQGTQVRISLPYRQTDSFQIRSPSVRYRSDGMNLVLTEFSVLLDKKYFARRMFD